MITRHTAIPIESPSRLIEEKTLFLVNCAYGALAHRKNVLYISLELDEERIAERILRRIALVDRKELRLQREQVAGYLDKFFRKTRIDGIG